MDECENTLLFRSTEEVPMVYDLSIDSCGNPVVHIEHSAWTRLCNDHFPQMSHWKEGLQATFNLPLFVDPVKSGRGSWGFGQVLKPFRDSKFVTFRVELPRAQAKKEPNWQALRAVSASLMVLQIALEMVELPTVSGKVQLLTLKNWYLSEHLSSGAAFSVVVSSPFVRWIGERGFGHQGRFGIRRAETAMRRAYARMFGSPLERFYDGWFRVSLREPKWIHFSCPGNCACLGRDGSDWDYGEEASYELKPHNVDTPLQQLALFAAVAKINQMARADGY
jgi:hypothetical protein